MSDVTEGRTNPEPAAPQPSGLFGNLPPPVTVEVVTAPTGNAPVVAPAANEPAPLVVSENHEDLMQRISTSLHKLGINVDAETMKAHLVAQLEDAAAAYENAKVGDDKSFLQKQSIRILAALHTLF